MRQPWGPDGSQSGVQEGPGDIQRPTRRPPGDPERTIAKMRPSRGGVEMWVSHGK